MKTKEQLKNQIDNLKEAIEQDEKRIEEQVVINIKEHRMRFPYNTDTIITLVEDIKRYERDIEIIEWILGKDTYYPYPK